MSLTSSSLPFRVITRTLPWRVSSISSRSSSQFPTRLPRTENSEKIMSIGYGGTANLKAIDMIFSEFSVLGSLVGNWDELRELIELTRQGKVRVITRKGKLDEVNEMLDQLKKGTLEGRGVVIP